MRFLIAASVAAAALAAPVLASADEGVVAPVEHSETSPHGGFQFTISADSVLIMGGVQAGLRYRYLEVDAGARYRGFDTEKYVGVKAILLPDQPATPYAFVRAGQYQFGHFWDEERDYSSSLVAEGLGVEIDLGHHAYIMLELAHDDLPDARKDDQHDDLTEQLEVGVGLGLRVF